MTQIEEQGKRSKKFAVGGELPPSPTTSTTVTTNKRPTTRHHVKRRSSGRVHVSKLAPMARAYSNTNEEPTDDLKKPMKRSQSNKSLTKLNEPKISMTAAPPTEPAPIIKKEEEIKPSSPPTTPPAQKKPLLKSQFVETKKMNNVASAATQQPTGMTRTQQKLLLQREQTLIHDENHIAHPKNMIRLTREMEKMGKEYRCVRKYQDPMMDILPQTSIPHLEQRRQILLKAALQHQQIDQENENKWSASHFLDRLFFGTS
ncbi:hypothetical protein INT48_008183 [Thamnidium elegans]|uniref:Uncharacterized protein n=1 Tax=Thamnidium elegans TaxID=101142 RepID=A0A8H7VWK1_9FUNG|nr:hypothetical protein INT48_008183 [Thamnidium elegans]